MSPHTYICRASCWRWFYLGICLALPLPAYSQDTPAPAFELSTIDHTKHSLRQSLGKIVYLDFWASWCAPCLQSFPFMNSLQQKYQAAGLQIIAINLDKKMDEAQSFLLNNPPQFLVLFDAEGKTPMQYSVKGMPSSYLIDRSGKIILSHKGFKPVDQNLIETKIRIALGMKE